MTSLSRRLISAVCAVTLATSLVPIPAFAETPSGGGPAEGEFEPILFSTETSVFEESLISPFALDENGLALLKTGSYEKWIDRLDAPQYVIDTYNLLREATDGDGQKDYLIEDKYFDGAAESDGVYANKRLLVATVPYSSSENPSAIFTEAARYIMAATAAFDRDTPEVFWLTGNWSIGGNYGSGKVNVYIQYEDEGYTGLLNASFQNESAIGNGIALRDSYIDKILAGISTELTDEATVRKFNDWLTHNNEYNTDLNGAKGGACPDAWECISALEGREGTKGPVCEAYSRAFKILCDKVGIPCVLVDGNAITSTGGGAHMWNYVKIAGSWYAVDVTWNDPAVGSGKLSGYENENWLLLGSDSIPARQSMSFITSHPVSNKVSDKTPGFLNGPELSKEKYSASPAYDCAVSGHVFGEFIETSRTEPTCSSAGSYTEEQSCSYCGFKQSRTVEIPMVSHTPGPTEEVGVEAATCETNGLSKVITKCKVCATVLSESEKEIPALGHKWSAWNTIEGATCQREGERLRYCLNDIGHIETQKIALAPHSPVVDEDSRQVMKDPTCEQPGSAQVDLICEVCKLKQGSKEAVIPAKGHSYGAWQTVKAATCTASGTERRVCKACGDVATRTVPARGHAFGAYRFNGDAQVNVDGTETARCSRCSATRTRTAAGSALAPTMGQTVAAAGATYQATGTATVTYAGPSNKKATSVTVPATVTISGRTYQVTSIASKAFAGNKALKSVKIGANVKSIPANAFKGCTKLASVSFGNGITSIGKNAFSGCKALKSVTLGTKVTTIGDGAFQNCAKLTKVTVKSTKLSKIGRNAFAGCKKLGTLTLKTTKLKSIGKNAFKGTKSKLTVKVPKKKLKTYQKLCKNKGCKTIRVKK